MTNDMALALRPISEPRVLDGVYSEDQYRRLLKVVRENGPWSLILAQHFKSPEEVIATTSGSIPEGFTPTWDMFLSPVFRGYLGEGGVAHYPEIEDCYYNRKFLNEVRSYWGAQYAQPEGMLFNIQGPCASGGSPHIDGTRFRGMDMHNTPVWLLNTMAKSGLFAHWQAKKAQVIAWYYRGTIGGGFHYWPDGPRHDPKLLPAPMWGRAVVVENEKMYHSAQANGPVSMRRPEGLAINSTMASDPVNAGGWVIETDGKIIQRIPEQEFRLLIHWGAQLYMDYQELKAALDHTDDIGHEQAFDIFIKDLRSRDEIFEMPTDPLHDTKFIQLLTRVYDPGKPHNIPVDPVEETRAA
jgi:hypothetical protein